MKRHPHRPGFTLILATLLCAAPHLPAQTPIAHKPIVGDQPATALPLANLSAKLTHRDVRRAIRKVGDWQLDRAQPTFDQDWTYAALYAGFMAVPDA